MHEMSIAEGIVDIALGVAEEHRASLVKNIYVDIGKLSGIEPDALQFCFDAVTRGTKAEGATLHIQLKPIEGCCIDCGHTFSVVDYTFRCPQCESTLVKVISGRELRVTSVDIDD